MQTREPSRFSPVYTEALCWSYKASIGVLEGFSSLNHSIVEGRTFPKP